MLASDGAYGQSLKLKVKSRIEQRKVIAMAKKQWLLDSITYSVQLNANPSLSKPQLLIDFNSENALDTYENAHKFISNRSQSDSYYKTLSLGQINYILVKENEIKFHDDFFKANDVAVLFKALNVVVKEELVELPVLRDKLQQVQPKALALPTSEPSTALP